jgi:hypothetical protein
MKLIDMMVDARVISQDFVLRFFTAPAVWCRAGAAGSACRHDCRMPACRREEGQSDD